MSNKSALKNPQKKVPKFGIKVNKMNESPKQELSVQKKYNITNHVLELAGLGQKKKGHPI